MASRFGTYGSSATAAASSLRNAWRWTHDAARRGRGSSPRPAAPPADVRAAPTAGQPPRRRTRQRRCGRTALNPPAARKAATRSTDAPARKLIRTGPGSPGRPGSGEFASSATIGSSTPAGSRMIRPVTTARSRFASRAPAQATRAPGSHHVSSSANATYGVVTVRTARLRATAPRFRRASMSSYRESAAGRPPRRRRLTRCPPRSAARPGGDWVRGTGRDAGSAAPVPGPELDDAADRRRALRRYVGRPVQRSLLSGMSTPSGTAPSAVSRLRG